MKTFIFSAIVLVIALGSVPVRAADAVWHLSSADSNIVYGSIKQDTIGENNHFTELSGTIDQDGQVNIAIDAMSVETNIVVRNERMKNYVFDAARPTITLTAQIDLPALEALAPGDTTMLDVEGTLQFVMLSLPVSAKMFVARLSDDKALAVTDEMIMLSTDDLGIEPGIDKLAELAGLDSITRVAPVTLRFVFEK